MKGKYILICGSASNSCSEAKLDRAIEFVERLVGEVLRRGGGLVILASDDSATLDSRGVPRIFDWVALREVERYVESTTEGPRKCARIVMPDHVVESRVSDGNLRTLTSLQQRGVVEVERIRREEYTGGAGGRLKTFRIPDRGIALSLPSSRDRISVTLCATTEGPSISRSNVKVSSRSMTLS